MSLALAFAQAVASSLTAGAAADAFSQPFSGAVRFNPRRAAASVDGYTVDVIPAPQSRETDSRLGPQLTQSVAIVIDRKVGGTGDDVDLEQTDAVVTLAEEFCAYLALPANRQMTTAGGSKGTVLVAQISDGLNLLDLELLEALNLARCVVTVTLRIH